MKTSHLRPQRLTVHNIAKVIKPKSNTKILWPSRTKLGQVKTPENSKMLDWCCPTGYSRSFTFLLIWKSGRNWSWGISSVMGLLKRFGKALQIVPEDERQAALSKEVCLEDVMTVYWSQGEPFNRSERRLVPIRPAYLESPSTTIKCRMSCSAT